MKKKTWKKPYIATLSTKELSKQIKAAARSGGEGCWAGDYR